MKNTAQRKNETHQAFINLDTFKFAMHIENNSTHYKELQNIFESNLNNWNALTIKEKIKNFLKSKKDYVKQNEKDFFISNVNFDSLVEYYIKDYINEYLKYKIEWVKFDVYFKRYFDKINWNSYFVFSFHFDYWIILNWNNIAYGYGNNLLPYGEVQSFIKNYNLDLQNLNKEFDLWYFSTQKILKQFIWLC